MDNLNLKEFDLHLDGKSAMGCLLCSATGERGNACNFILIFAGRTSAMAASIFSPYLFPTKCKLDDGNHIQVHQNDSVVRMVAAEGRGPIPPRQISRSRTER